MMPDAWPWPQALVAPGRQRLRSTVKAAWLLRSRLQAVTWSVRALAGFAAVSLQEDRLGLLQLTEPTLGSVLQVYPVVG